MSQQFERAAGQPVPGSAGRKMVDLSGPYSLTTSGEKGGYVLVWTGKRGEERRWKLGRITLGEAREAMSRCAAAAELSPRQVLKRAERLEECAGRWLERRPGSSSIFLGWYDAPSRQTRHVSLKSSDVAFARRQLYRCADAPGEDPRKILARPRMLTVGELLDSYFEKHGNKLASAEQAAIAIAHLKAVVGRRYCGSFSFADSVDLAQELVSQGRSIAYASRILSVLRSAFRLAEKNKLVPAAPDIFEPRTPAHMEAEPLKGDYLELDQLARLADEAQELHVLEAFVLLYNTAARIRSILDLRPSQADLSIGLLRLNPPGRIQTNKRRAILKIPATLQPWLVDRSPDQTLVSRNGRAVGSIKTAFRGMRARAGLGDRVNTYSVRHTLARWMERQRVPDKQISVVLGHVPVTIKRTTLRYTERPESPEYLREATESIESFVREIAARTHRVDLLVPPWMGGRGLGFPKPSRPVRKPES